MQKSTNFAKFLPVLVGVREFQPPVWYAALGAPRSFQTIHRDSASQEMGAANSISADRVCLFLAKTPAFVRVSLLVHRAFLLCCAPKCHPARALEHSRFHEPQGKTHAFQKGNWFRRFLRDAVRSTDDGPLYRDQMRHNFRHGPIIYSGLLLPLIVVDRIGCAQKSFLRCRELLEDGGETSHRNFVLGIPTAQHFLLARRHAPVAARVPRQTRGR